MEYSYAAMVLGLFSFSGGLLNWGLFCEHKQDRRFSSFSKRFGTRVFYAFLGIAIFVLGLLPLISKTH